MSPHSKTVLMEPTASAKQQLVCQVLKFSKSLLGNKHQKSFESQQFLEKKEEKKGKWLFLRNTNIF